jgi:hypothetical protein
MNVNPIATKVSVQKRGVWVGIGKKDRFGIGTRKGSGWIPLTA